MTEKADIIVLGVGGCGASALYRQARRGLRVVGRIGKTSPVFAKRADQGR